MDYILCEDTRRAQKLKNHFSLRPRLVSFHEHNEKTRVPKVIALMQRGKTFALISDAGAPLISDPGLHLVSEMIRNGLTYTYVPGPSAVIAALVLSGFPGQPFSFFGFLAVSPSARTRSIQQMATLTSHTLILFESPERVVSLVREIGEVCGDRRIAICREMTKLHEEVLRGTVSELLPQLVSRKLQGEFTVVIAPGEAPATQMTDESIRARYAQLVSEGYSRRDALKKLVKESGRSRNDLYRLIMT